MTTLEPAGEIVGLDQSIAYARRLAALAGEHTPAAGEGYLAHLAAEHLDGAAVRSAEQMQAAFAEAQAAAERHATELQRQHGVQAAYDRRPDAGDKAYQQTSAGAAAPAAPADRIGGGEQELPMVISDEERARLHPKHSPQTAAERRRELMRHHGIYRCPDWCVQDDEEDQYEEHWGDWTSITTDDGDELAVRPRMSWWDDSGEDHVEVRITPAPSPVPVSGDQGVYLNTAAVQQLRDLLDAAESAHEHHRTYDDPDATIPAYDGAEDDEVAQDEHAVDEDLDEDQVDEADAVAAPADR
jgi:hypothetical protein